MTTTTQTRAPTTFGIEIEFFMPTATNNVNIATKLSTACGMRVNHERRGSAASPRWKIVNDGSVRGPSGLHGFEAVSPPITSNDFSQLDTICSGLSSIGARINRSCGLHVHIGAVTLSLDVLKRLAVLYAASESFLDALLPPSRRGDLNTYCKSLKTHLDLRKALAAPDVSNLAQATLNGARYVKLNFASYWKHGTVEFRQHSGTLDPEKIRNWALLCEALLKKAEEDVTQPSAIPVTTTPASTGTGASYWARGRRRQTMIRMISRPVGATDPEVTAALGLAAPSGVATHVNRSRDTRIVREGRREGHPVYYLRATGAPQTPAAPVASVSAVLTTLEGFLDSLPGLQPQRAYWLERAALLETN